MRVGIPKEIKSEEYRVGMTPAGVREMLASGHEVIIEAGAGIGSGFPDESYKAAGATIMRTAAEVFASAEMLVKVKEPQPHECRMLRKGHVLFTYLHLAPDREQAELLMESACTAIAYETITDDRGRLPLLAPMSEVAGRMAAQVGARCLEKSQGGGGILMGGVPGVLPAAVIVLGGGVVGLNAARVALGMGANVTIMDSSLKRLAEIDAQFGPALKTVYASLASIETQVQSADVVIGAVLAPGAAAPRLVTHQMLTSMRPGAVLVDVAIDQGGCFETSHPTTHADPTYIVDGTVHYCVANMPGGVPRTSTLALTDATLPYVLRIARDGWRKALAADEHLRDGLNVFDGSITCEPVALALDFPYVPAKDAV